MKTSAHENKSAINTRVKIRPIAIAAGPVASKGRWGPQPGPALDVIGRHLGAVMAPA